MGLDMWLSVSVDGVEKDGVDWRKANAVHRWFTEKGVENRHVTRRELVELVDVCKAVRADPDAAETLLPTPCGFFFGDTHYGDQYMYDVEYTIEELERILADETLADATFSYSSSW